MPIYSSYENSWLDFHQIWKVCVDWSASKHRLYAAHESHTVQLWLECLWQEVSHISGQINSETGGLCHSDWEWQALHILRYCIQKSRDFECKRRLKTTKVNIPNRRCWFVIKFFRNCFVCGQLCSRLQGQWQLGFVFLRMFNDFPWGLASELIYVEMFHKLQSTIKSDAASSWYFELLLSAHHVLIFASCRMC